MQEEKSLEPWWLKSKAGQLFAHAEKEVLDEVLQTMYGYYLVQCAPPKFASFVSSSMITHRIIVNQAGNSNWPCSIIEGSNETLGIANDSVDVVVLTHSLEQAKKPHQVLREAHRILIPEGKVIITGINPFSFCGVWSLIRRLLSSKEKHRHNSISANRVKDWLHLLDFEVTQTRHFFYRPPISNHRIMAKLTFFERIGLRYFSFFGGGFAIIANKKVTTMTPIKPAFAKKQEPIWDAEGVANRSVFNRDNS